MGVNFVLLGAEREAEPGLTTSTPSHARILSSVVSFRGVLFELPG